MITQAQILTKVEAFLKKTGMSATAFGKNCLGDPNFVSDMRTVKRCPSFQTFNKIEDFMKSGDIP